MTSVASYGAATTAGNYTLVFSGTRVGSLAWIEGYTSSMRRATEVVAQHPFWGSEAVLDGRYPALVWLHRFRLHMVSSTREDFMETFFNLSQHYSAERQALGIFDGDTATVVASFGTCLMTESAVLEEPDELLSFAEGKITVNFIGTKKPTVR